MRAKIFGNRYEFIIELGRFDNAFSFEILSLFKATGQKSIITNLNLIISELVFPLLETTDVDTTVILNKQQGTKLFNTSKSFFKNKYWIKLLEENLDEDRNIGGWNSDFKF